MKLTDDEKKVLSILAMKEQYFRDFSQRRKQYIKQIEELDKEILQNAAYGKERRWQNGVKKKTISLISQMLLSGWKRT